MSDPHYEPTPDEIRAACAIIRAEKGELPESHRTQRIDLRSLFDLVGGDHEDEDEDGNE